MDSSTSIVIPAFLFFASVITVGGAIIIATCVDAYVKWQYTHKLLEQQQQIIDKIPDMNGLATQMLKAAFPPEK